MKTKSKAIFVIISSAFALVGRSSAAVQLSSLQNPTLQTLINLGSTGVDVGQTHFDDFTFLAGGSGPATASQIQAEPKTGAGDGLEFIATWFAADGASVANVITYQVAADSPASSLGWIDLFSNGTAPVPVAGTFTTATLTAQTPAGAPAASTLSTYDDGSTTPVDTTKPDVNFATTTIAPQDSLEITDSIYATSTAPSASNSGGLATISVVQNTFGLVPEPLAMGWIFPSATLLLARPRRKLPRNKFCAAMNETRLFQRRSNCIAKPQREFAGFPARRA